MTTTVDSNQQLNRGLAQAHDGLVIFLTAVAPFLYAHGGFGPALPVWFGLIGLGWLVCSLEWARGIRPGLRWNWGGLIALGLLAWLIQAAAGAPNPANSWGRWALWSGLLVWVGYLMQVLPERRSLVWASLVGTIAVQLIVTAMQGWYVQPAIADAVQANEPSVQTLIQAAGSPDAVLERLTNGGVYGTFTLANTLGIWSVLVGMPFIVWTWQRIRSPETGTKLMSVIPLIILAIALLVLLGSTGAKGAVAALIGGILLWLVQTRFPRWRWPLSALILGGSALCAWLLAPHISSIEVRVGYWRAALLLASEHLITGLGIGGFEAWGSHAFRPQDEFSRFAHNGLLEALVAGGLIASAGLGWIMLRWLFAPQDQSKPQAEFDNRPAKTWWITIIGLPYMILLGMLVSDNLSWWPGGQSLIGQLGYGLGLGLVHALTVRFSSRLAPPPPSSFACALGIFVLASCIDFHWQETGLLAHLLVIAAFAAKTHTLSSHPRSAFCGFSVVIILAIGLLLGAGSGQQLTQARSGAASLKAMQRAAQTQDSTAMHQAAEDLAFHTGQPNPSSEAEVAALYQQGWQMVHKHRPEWPRDPQLDLDLATLHPDRKERRRLTQQQAERMPWSAIAQRQLSMVLAASGDWGGAAAAMASAVQRSPALLAYRSQLIAVLERAQSEHQRVPGITDVAAEITVQQAFIDQHRDSASHSHRP